MLVQKKLQSGICRASSQNMICYFEVPWISRDTVFLYLP